MINRKTMMLAGLVALTAGGWALHALAQSPRTAPEPGRTYRIGYSQIVDHPALNETRRGFLDGLRQSGFVVGQNLVFDYQNAQGDVGNARLIAEKFIADRVDMIAPCTTPNVQAAIRIARGSGIPVVFGCVTNPVDTGILQSLEQPSGANLTGHYGLPPIAQMLDIIQQLRPDARRVGTIYNAAEANSQSIVRRAKAEAERRGLTWIEVQIASSAEVRNAAESLIGRVDVILTPQDNTVASAYDAVTRVTRENRIPLFSLDITTVERGAIASYSNNQYQTGVEWALDVAVPVLLGRDAGTILATPYRAFDLYVNTASAAAVGITLPPELLERAARRFDR